MFNLWPLLLFPNALSLFMEMEQIMSHACLARPHRTAAEWGRSLEGARCTFYLSSTGGTGSPRTVLWRCFPILPTRFCTWALRVLPLQVLLGAYPPSSSPLHSSLLWAESKRKEDPCYFKWSLTQLHKERKIKPFSQAITPRQLKQTENSITAHYCRIQCSLSLSSPWLLEKGWEEAKGQPLL